MSLHLSKCHIVGNLMHWLIIMFLSKVAHVSVLTLAPATLQFPNVELQLTISCSIAKKTILMH